jgi:hypothetical protein
VIETGLSFHVETIHLGDEFPHGTGCPIRFTQRM